MKIKIQRAQVSVQLARLIIFYLNQKMKDIKKIDELKKCNEKRANIEVSNEKRKQEIMGVESDNKNNCFFSFIFFHSAFVVLYHCLK
jgi:hypothetical protein